ncbi:MAG: hypothetical protein EOP45_17405 [Sphingobacteriaceae bacterium]|nr:MAG: hypothetical protein EOP45_17405 [Sphingobacteriaceae bacterium]
MKLWLDANDIKGDATTVFNDGNSVGYWADKSLFGQNAYVITGTPTYASVSSKNSVFQKGSIYFDGSSSYTFNLGFLNNSDYTFFVVYSSSIYNNNTVSPFSTSNNKQSWVMYAGTGADKNQAFQVGPRMIGNVFTQYWGHNQNDTSVSVAEQPLTNQLNKQSPYIVMGAFNQANATRTLLVRSNNGLAAKSDYVGGTTGQALSTLTTTNGKIASCSSVSSSLCNGYRGYIAEIIFYTRTLTIAEQKQVEGYLLRKWFSGECQ